MSPALSVVLPNYNHAKFIGRALAALLSQERAADEIIVIDDGSTDDSVAVIERIAATAPAIRLLRNPNNVGVIPTLQRGLEAARGKYVYFAASDDWVFPGFFALALRRLKADPDIGWIVKFLPATCRGLGPFRHPGIAMRRTPGDGHWPGSSNPAWLQRDGTTRGAPTRRPDNSRRSFSPANRSKLWRWHAKKYPAPPVGVTHQDLIQMAHDWVDALRGKFQGGRTCGCITIRQKKQSEH